MESKKKMESKRKEGDERKTEWKMRLNRENWRQRYKKKVDEIIGWNRKTEIKKY